MCAHVHVCAFNEYVENIYSKHTIYIYIYIAQIEVNIPTIIVWVENYHSFY